jgi:hypothetical protein
LIHTAWGRAGGTGIPRTKRSGVAAKAVRKVASRSASRVSARPWWTSNGVSNPKPLW